MSAPARLVGSAAGTGAGKTLIALALCRAFRDAGFRVGAYKAGPDYIDARLYASVLGASAHNLDLWLDGEEGVRRHVALTAGDADIVIVEGMMGLFDGDDAGATSTAGIALALDAPVLPVLDTWSASQSAAAVALGLRAYDPHVRHLGVILNRVGGGRPMLRPFERLARARRSRCLRQSNGATSTAFPTGYSDSIAPPSSPARRRSNSLLPNCRRRSICVR